MNNIENRIKELERFPIYMTIFEMGIVANMVVDRRNEIPDVWKQFKPDVYKKIKQGGGYDIEEKFPINMNAFEIGFITSILADRRDEIPELWKQLMEMLKKFRESNNVRIDELEDSLVKITDADGISIIREKYEWE